MKERNRGKAEGSENENERTGGKRDEMCKKVTGTEEEKGTERHEEEEGEGEGE